MANKKSNNLIGVFSIFLSSIKTYFLYLDQCAKYLAFPILGQFISIALILSITYYFSINEYNIRNLMPFFESDRNYYTTFWIVLLPFLIVFTKAIYDYIIAFAALNILFYTVSNKKKVKDIDFKSNKKVIERKLVNYIVLMFIITVMLCIPPLIFISPIIWIFLCLSFQVFALENNVSAIGALSRSIELVKSNFISTVIMLVLCSFTTYFFFPSVFVWASDKIMFTSFIAQNIDKYINLISLTGIDRFLAGFNMSFNTLTVSRTLAEMTVSSFVVAFTLPFRCCCFTNLYRLYDNGKIKEYSKDSEEIIKRASNTKGKN